ncbi:hypothetical protein B0T14DRAFT_437805 [Immersiella caudata]|uniref:Complex I intermediate-associated protein 84 n=1 Tax=Immersiella caudata TaxID=314043 RepID=A0AA39WEX3_9PEZI|nr:hypothetical protein B0T14DRAFT_437805 [Immersiella caudata]
MRSQLTRNVYRRLLTGHGLLRPCPAPSGRCYYSQVRPKLPAHSLFRHPLRRTFLGLFQAPPRELKEPEIEPGYDVLLKFRAMETENARPPPREELVHGLAQFFRHKRKSHVPITETQAFLATRVLRHLVDNPPNDEAPVESIYEPMLRHGLRALRRMNEGRPGDLLELTKLIYTELEWRKEARVLGGIENHKHKDKDDANLMGYIDCLTKFGGSMEAIERLSEYRSKLSAEERTSEYVTKLWGSVLGGLAREGRETELLAEFRHAEEEEIAFSPSLHEIMTTFYMARGRVEEAKRWFEKPIHGNQTPTPTTYSEMLRFSVQHGLQQWSQPFFEKLIRSNPEKALWDVAFQWSVLVTGKGVEGIKQMMATMERTSGHKPDATTIDSLLSAAIEKKNPYLAERFISLGAELGIEPQPTTYILQLNYRLDAEDFSGAEAIYQKILNQEVNTHWVNLEANTYTYSKDVNVLNKYLCLLCRAEKPDIQRILEVTAQIEMRPRTHLLSETIVALCMVLLRHDQQFDVIDTLSLHTVTLSLEDRAQIRKAFVEYCLDTTISTARVWDAYSLLRQFFPETEQADRVSLMDAFFARRRPDMACTVFGHMRGHANPVQRPTADIYVRCLEGLGRRPNYDSLKQVHNMLKMDTTVNVDTRIRNGLMIGYTAAGDPSTALEFWEQISASSEGPSYNSLAIVFWTCECLELRDDTAKQIWQKMQRMELDVPPSVSNAYCGALAGQGELNEVKRLIGGLEANQGYSPSLMTFGITYNALPGPAKVHFEEWAKEEYPEIWARLESKGRKKTIDGDMFNIVRNLEA